MYSVTCNRHVVVLALDFSKAFDTVRHSTLLHKMAQLDLPDTVYNWLVNFNDHQHCTEYNRTSSLTEISASVVYRARRRMLSTHQT